jgi:hypothetical protein
LLSIRAVLLAEALGKPGQRFRKALGDKVGVGRFELACDGREATLAGTSSIRGSTI